MAATGCGTTGGGKSRPTGKIDIAVMQSLSRRGEVSALVERYGQAIVDECHHVGAVSFDGILKRAKDRSRRWKTTTAQSHVSSHFRGVPRTAP